MDFSSSILTSKLKKSRGGPLPRWCRWSGTRGATLEKNRQLWGQSVKPEALAKHADRFSGDVITKCRPHVLWLELNWWVQLVLTFPSWHCIGQEEPKSCKRKKPHPKRGESQLFKDVIFSSEGHYSGVPLVILVCLTLWNASATSRRIHTDFIIMM